MHDRHEAGALVDLARDVGGIDAALAVDTDHAHPDMRVPLEVVRRIEHRVVLDRAHDEAVLFVAPASLEGTAEREVIRLGATAREHDLRRLRADRGGDLHAGLVDESASGATLGVDARGVPVALAEDASHRLRDLGVDRRGRGVIEIDALHG